MSILERLLLVVVLIVSIVVGVFILANVPSSSKFIAVDNNPIKKVINWDLPSGSSPLNDAISRLSMIPFSKRERKMVAVVIENHEDARPHHRGLDSALLIQEHMVEGFISRFVALYDLRTLPDLIGPVRSLRPYFIDSVIPLSSVFLHAGGSPDAILRVEGDPNLTSINGLYLDDRTKKDPEYFRLPGIPAPHDLFTGKETVGGMIPSDSSSFAWPPYKTGGARSASGASSVRINFFNQDHNVTFEFKRSSGDYKRVNGGTISPTKPRNIIILEMPIKGEGKYGRLDIDSFGEGAALFFRSGRIYNGKWKRKEDDTWFIFEDLDGEPMVFAQGQTWMMGVPSLGRVSWE
ncbi:MAG: DUF3048 domain-containing protein [Candidatus Peribacteraceae bacterium]|nr:DUF3048 domain-containing protein [Candidatus Peribacteraceae bacterium]